MGMVGESMAADNANRLEKILLEAIDGHTWSDVRSATKSFAKRNLYQWYLDECTEGFVTPNQDIIKEFEPNKFINK